MSSSASATSATRDAPRYTLGQQVRVIANRGGLYAAQIGVVGVVSKQRQKRRYGYRSYDVSYMKPFSLPNEKGREKIVIVREDDLEAVTEDGVSVTDDAHPVTDSGISVTELPLTPLSEPKFSVGEHVYVDPRSERAYATYTRKGAIGVIVGVGRPVRGIRRYDVRYSGTAAATSAALKNALHQLPVAQIREEHLVSDEGRLRHACEYRAEQIAAKRLRPGEQLWCDKGGCFEDDCVVCQQTPEWRERHGLALSTPPPPMPKPARAREMPYSTAALSALAAGDSYEFALTLVQDKLERGVWPDAILAWQSAPQWIHSVDGGTCYDVTRGGIYLTMLNGQKCSIRYALKALVAVVQARIAGVPQQASLWGSEARV